MSLTENATARISAASTRPLRVGLFGIGLDAYWPQFVGLKERLEGYLLKVQAQLQRPNVEVVNLGLIDTPQKAMDAGHSFRQADVDLIFLHVTTYVMRCHRRCCRWFAGRSSPSVTATVYLPTSDPSKAAESGRPIAAGSAIQKFRSEPGAAVVEIGSGTYRFTAPAPRSACRNNL